MKKVAVFLSLIFVAILLQSCGGVVGKDVTKAVLEQSKYLVKITVDVDIIKDPLVYIFAKEAVYSKEGVVGTLLIKEGYLGSYSGSLYNSAIFIKEAVFHFKFPTTVTIENLDKN